MLQTILEKVRMTLKFKRKIPLNYNSSTRRIEREMLAKKVRNHNQPL